MNALLRARPIDPENSFFKVNPGLSKREALDEASVILAGLSDILISLVEGSPMDGNGYHALAYLSDAAKALVDAAIRQVKRLNDELGHGTRYATVTAVENATGTKYPFNAYVHLRKWCKANGVQPEIVPDRRFGEVKAWPAGAWAAVYQIDLATLFGASGAKA
ncbi:hypothetical protein NRF81_002040 [Pseudomonas aeruginosa]|nr:DUF3077 domain-containing protein [Pseudomonas aeruginosa]ELS4715383.1 DUF3077 domain-containing protein [Pseudomonas aeruginosa]